METAVVRQFLDFFTDFLELCQTENWPNDKTSEDEIKNAFLISQHVEKMLARLQEKDLIDNFIQTVNQNGDIPNILLKNCLVEPSKYVLKRLLNADCSISQVDKGITIFLSLHSENKLEEYLTDLMVEAASKEVLVRSVSKLPRQEVLKFKSNLLLSEINHSEDSSNEIGKLMINCDADNAEMLAICLLNKNVNFNKSVGKIKKSVETAMKSKLCTYKSFWHSLLNLNEELLLELCYEHHDFFVIITKALIDSSRLIRESMSAEFFYIDLSYAELVLTTQKICKNDVLKEEFLTYVGDCADLEFWNNVLS